MPSSRFIRMFIKQCCVGCTCVLSLFCFLALSLVLLQNTYPSTTSLASSLKKTKVLHVKVTFNNSKKLPGVLLSSTTSQLKSQIDLGAVSKQRLKPWLDFTVIGNPSLCPDPALNNSRSLAADCPNFYACDTVSMDTISYCRNRGIEQVPDIPMVPPVDVRGSLFRNVDYTRSTLPWQSDVVQIKAGGFSQPIYVNHIGQVFDSNTQWLHGGCQDETDDDHGGPRVYNPEDKSLETVNLAEVINLLHLYGDNYYHFMIEVLPRFKAIMSILDENANIPILMRTDSPVHLLHDLLGVDTEKLNFVFMSEENSLIAVSRSVIVPLSQRCLHTNADAWDAIREQWSQEFPSRFGINFRSEYLNEYKKNSKDSPDHHCFPLVKIVYSSRINSSPRRNLAEEEAFIDSIRTLLFLDKETRGTPRLTLADSEQSLKSGFGLTHYSSSPLLPPSGKGFAALRQNDPLAKAMAELGGMFSLTILYGNESLETTISTLADASLFIGPHGAGLANMVFLPTNARVLELSPANGYYNPCYTYLSNALGLHHTMVVMKGTRASQLKFARKDVSLDNKFSIPAEALFTMERVAQWVHDKAWLSWRTTLKGLNVK